MGPYLGKRNQEATVLSPKVTVKQAFDLLLAENWQRSQGKHCDFSVMHFLKYVLKNYWAGVCF